MPKVSIIVPFWGVEKYIGECVESIISQTFQDFELLLIDDCSRDQSRSIAEKYAATDSRIKIITHEHNTGQGGARNTGLKEAHGKYIWYIDSDDCILDKTSLEKIYSSAERYSTEVLFFDCIRNNQGKEEYIASAESFSQGLYDSNSSVERFVIDNFKKIHFVWNKFFTKEFLLKNCCNFLEHTNHQDSIQLLWVFNADRTYYLREAHYLYRLRSESTMTSKKDARSFEHVCKMSKAYDDYFFSSMKNSRNSRIITLAEKIYFLMLAGASARCYQGSSDEDKKLIIEMSYKNLSQSKIFELMAYEEICEAMSLFEEEEDLIKLASSIYKKDALESELIISRILKNKNDITLKKILKRFQSRNLSNVF